MTYGNKQLVLTGYIIYIHTIKAWVKDTNFTGIQSGVLKELDIWGRGYGFMHFKPFILDNYNTSIKNICDAK